MRFYLLLITALTAALLSSCNSTLRSELGLSSSAQADESPQTTIGEERQLYHQGGGTVTKTEVAALKHYAKPQSYKAIRGLLGSPRWVTEGQDIYIVEGTGDQVVTPQRLVVLFAVDDRCNYDCSKAVDWYLSR